MVSHSQAAAAYEDDLDFSDSPVHSVVEMSQRPTGLGPGELKIAGYNNQQLDSHFPESPRSSRLGSFMGNDPKFESPGASSASEELVDAQQQKPLVTVVWRNLNIVSIPVSVTAFVQICCRSSTDEQHSTSIKFLLHQTVKGACSVADHGCNLA